MPTPELVLVSACLVGMRTRYDGRTKDNPELRRQLAGTIWIPVCPEQLGGLATPRPAADLQGGSGADVLDGTARVITRDGTDVTRQFLEGARQVLELAQVQSVTRVLLKSRSPSCGVDRLGVTAALLTRHGIAVTEYD